MGRKKGSSRRFEATIEQRKKVSDMAAVGITHEQIAAVLGISADTLTKHFRSEIDTASPNANLRVAQSLYVQALEGNTAAAIFWLKCRARWREQHDPEALTGGGDVSVTLKVGNRPIRLLESQDDSKTGT
jgi:hypothetical protein